jgi:hypothetical protein
MILTSWSSSVRLMIGLMGIGLALVGLSQWRKKTRCERTRGVVIDRASIIVDSESRAEIVFGPEPAVTDPKVVISAHGRPVIVEGIWHNDVCVLASSRRVDYWHRGIVYTGIVDATHTIKILLHNQGFTPAMVRAKLVVPETAED